MHHCIFIGQCYSRQKLELILSPWTKARYIGKRQSFNQNTGAQEQQEMTLEGSMKARSLKCPGSHDKDFEVYLGCIVELLKWVYPREDFLINFLPQDDLLSCATVHLQNVFLWTRAQRHIQWVLIHLTGLACDVIHETAKGNRTVHPSWLGRWFPFIFLRHL